MIGMMMLEQWQRRAKQLKTETYALYLAYRDPRVPWYAKVFAAMVLGYASSPIDLVPDFVPVLGYLDDLLLVPVGITLALKMVPKAVLDECKQDAREVMAKGTPTNWVAAGVVVVIWILCIALIVAAFARLLKK